MGQCPGTITGSTDKLINVYIIGKPWNSAYVLSSKCTWENRFGRIQVIDYKGHAF
jgi:hypothetical protein